jgi:hypothetical protein
LARLDAQLDEEYEQKVPPFKPAAFAGRADKAQDRVVLVELFTGAQCPPCVAADVAFDALLKSYKPTEMIGLQYHLHIPGPDPLTNTDTETRAKYYQVRGTPTMVFNGEAVESVAGGGPMAFAENKYNDYRKVIEPLLEESKQAKIDLKLNCSGETLNIEALAEAVEKKEAGKLRLRLVVTEEVIRYVGGNKLRLHHHVVRDMPGGPEGKELVAGQAQLSQSVDLSHLREELQKYLNQQAEQRPFPNPLPEIKFENLSVAAFVQDDANKNVLHAVVMKVPAAK